MIIHSLCNTCFQRFEISAKPADTHILRQLKDERGLGECPRHCGGRINLVNPTSETFGAMVASPILKDPISITVDELYRAANGGGLPDEIPSSKEAVLAMLKAFKVKEVDLSQVGKDIYLNELILENGCILHLAAGRLGAQVFKITKEG